MAKKKTLAEQYLEAKEKLEVQEEKTEKKNVIDTIEKLQKEIQRRIEVLKNKKAPLQCYEKEELETLKEELEELLGE